VQGTARLCKERVLLPRGSEHEMAHSPLAKAIPLETFLAERDGLAWRSR
jgi:hypothetical protein